MSTNFAGGRVYANRPGGWPKLTPGQSDFLSLFSPVLPDLDRLRWLFEPEGLGNIYWGDWPDDRIEEVQDAVNDLVVDSWANASKKRTLYSFVLLRGEEFIPVLGASIRDDWNRFAVLREDASDINHAIALWDQLSGSNPRFRDLPPSERTLAAEVFDTLFENYDGAYWAFYTPDQFRRTQLLSAALRWGDQVNVVQCTLEQTCALHWGSGGPS